MEIYYREYALVISCITRWGTLLGMMKLVRRVRAAISAYYENIKDSEMGEKLASARIAVIDPKFWEDLAFAIELLTLISEAIQAGESDRSTLGYVLPRWKSILKTF